MIITSVSGDFTLAASTTSKPEPPGIFISDTMRSYSTSDKSAMAFLGFSATSTLYPFCSNVAFNKSRINASSSTTKMYFADKVHTP